MAEKVIESALHHPYSLQAAVFLKCSCGYNGLAAVDTDAENEVASCPNCGSQTVHPKHVTEFPTTIHQFEDGTKETVVANAIEDKKPITPNVAPTAEEVVSMVLKHPVFDRLNKFMDAQDAKGAN